MKRFLASLFAAFFLITAPVSAATFTDLGNQTLQIEGIIEIGDDVIFADLYNAKIFFNEDPYLHVILKNSEGGAFAEAVNIGSNIDEFDLSTETEGYCFSSCAYIWLAGSRIYAHPKDMIWIHAPFTMAISEGEDMDEAVVPPESKEVAVMNEYAVSLASWYLGKIGMSPNAVIDMVLNARGDSIYAFNGESGLTYGFNLNIIEDGTHGR